jgi:hypothetical protein
MACGAHGQLRRSLPRHSARSDPRHHPREPEVLRAARSAHGGLANRFILTSNLVATDGGQAIVAGNERVVRARLSTPSSSGNGPEDAASKSGWRS